jgi:hypothetical protein
MIAVPATPPITGALGGARPRQWRWRSTTGTVGRPPGAVTITSPKDCPIP